MKTLKMIEVRNFFDGIAASLLAISNQSVRYQQWRQEVLELPAFSFKSVEKDICPVYCFLTGAFKKIIKPQTHNSTTKRTLKLFSPN
jgi:hypothetical protein